MNFKGLMVYIFILTASFTALQRPLVLLIFIPIALIFYKKLIRQEYSVDIIEDRSLSVIKNRYPDDAYLIFPYLNSKEYSLLYNNNRYYSKLSFRFDTAVRESYDKYKRDFSYKQTIKLQDFDNLEENVKGIVSLIIINCYPKDAKFLTNYFSTEIYKKNYEILSELTIFNDTFAGLILTNYGEYRDSINL